jgi:hypothetical protein
MNVDKTTLLEQVMQRYGKDVCSSGSSSSGQQQARHTAADADLAVLGEFQFAFIAFVCGQSLEGRQGRRLLLCLPLCVCIWHELQQPTDCACGAIAPGALNVVLTLQKGVYDRLLPVAFCSTLFHFIPVLAKGV